MKLKDRLEESLIDSLMPPELNLKEKIYYWTAQVNAVMLPLSLLYTMVGDNPHNGIALGVNTVLCYGGLFLLKNSYNHRHGEQAMTLNLKPSISFFKD